MTRGHRSAMETVTEFLRILNVNDALLILFAYTSSSYYCYCGSSGSMTDKIINQKLNF